MTGNDAKGLLIAAKEFGDRGDEAASFAAVVDVVAGLFDLLHDIQFRLQNLDERDQNRTMGGR